MRVRPRSTHHKPGIRRTPRRRPATRNDGLSQSSTCTRQTRIGRQANSLPAFRHRGTMGLPKVRHGHDTVHGPAPAASSPAHRPSGAAGLPRRSRRTDELTTSQRRHRGTMGLPKVRHGHDTVHGPAPAASSPAHRPSGAAGLPRRSRRTRRAHDVSTPTQVVPPSKAATRAPRLNAGPAPPLPRRYAHLTSFL